VVGVRRLWRLTPSRFRRKSPTRTVTQAETGGQDILKILVSRLRWNEANGLVASGASGSIQLYDLPWGTTAKPCSLDVDVLRSAQAIFDHLLESCSRLE
jgi:hypothetical protein